MRITSVSMSSRATRCWRSTLQIWRVERQQRVALLDMLTDVIRIQALHPATDPSVDVHEVGLGVLQYPDRPHRGSYRALGRPSKRDAEPRGFDAIERDPRRVGAGRWHSRHPLHVRSGSLLASRQRHGCEEQPDDDPFHGWY